MTFNEADNNNVFAYKLPFEKLLSHKVFAKYNKAS